jgi:hypothetical protein
MKPSNHTLRLTGRQTFRGYHLRQELRSLSLSLPWLLLESRYIAAAWTTQETQFYCKNHCVTEQLVTENPIPTVAWRGRHRKHSFFYCCVMYRVYRAAAWQCGDQMRYSIYVFYMIVTINRDYSLNNINWMIFALEMMCIFCEVGYF